MVLIYSTFDSYKEVKEIAEHLLKKRLVACVNIFENKESIYLWENKCKSEKEFVLIAKTKKELGQSVTDEIKKKHSYEIPCVLSIPCEANEEYNEWIKKVVK
ncbi:MAG: divalent-cation tolerance protein CutA [Gammaproteobacteria bacterium]|nr:divalent-cation tolerance protein CutA [Gammaproteobacteria bacterium]